MGRSKPLAYLHREHDKWAVTCVARPEQSVSADTRTEAAQLGAWIGWTVQRFTPWDDPPTK